MPRFESVLTFARPLDAVFEFFLRPANLLRANPPDLNLQLVEAPLVVQLGSRIVLQARRFGVAQRLVSEVTAWQLQALLVDEQREGPFRKWVQTHRFEGVGAGTRLTYQVDYEPPGGMLGLVLNARAIDKELQTIGAFRAVKLAELLNHPAE